ncbi:sterol desaturase family protein [Solimonas terrae]|uniref:Sterol desaturase family protein n=1 Tax=Solimonas terrae TaxID=1396819 RepID=A0A6M2BNX5_9GAMM|nr:sterol desaturase family protein [Solimonas terrae]NGY03733.1 sterol desaturase family protein [Solimonas terrae]
MDAVDLFGLLIPVTFFVMLAAEARWPARAFPPRRGWRWLGIGFLFLLAAASSFVPLLLPTPWMTTHRLIDGSDLGIGAGIVVGWIVLSFCNYLWHRNVHRVDWLWRGFHQMHHSADRVDIAGSAIFHPLEMVVFVTISTTVTTLILGLQPVAAAAVGYVAAFYSIFQHWNVRTPVWLGYWIQRPESHCLHHERGVQNFNYADFPLWDLLFGTFRNLPDWQGDAGFGEPASRQYGAMLVWRDVNLGQYGSASRGVAPHGPPA